MKSGSPLANGLITAALPLAFLGPGFLNALAFPLGLHTHDAARTLVTFGILAASALLLFCRVVLLFAKDPDLRRPILAASLVLILFGAVYLWALAVHEDKAWILREGAMQGFYLTAASCALILIIAEKRLRSFLRACRICGLILSPILLFYCVRFYIPSICNRIKEAMQRVADLGMVDYMSLSYTVLPLCLFLMAEMFLYIGNAGGKRDWFVLGQNIALLLLGSITIALSGTKGAMLCLAAGGCLLLIYAHLVKRSRRVCRAYLLLTILPIVLFSTVLYPSSLGESRSVSFIREMFSQSPTLLEDEMAHASDIIQDTPGEESAPQTVPIPEAAPAPEDSPASDGSFVPETDVGSKTEGPPDPTDIFAVVGYVSSGRLRTDLDAGRITEEEADALFQIYNIASNTTAATRSYLLSCALREIQAAPLTGQGVFFFQAKYGTYPHNFFLELATDFGLPVMLLTLALGLYVFARLIRFSMENAVVGMFLLYVLSFLPQAMLSASLYGYFSFFQYGFCILLVFYIVPHVQKDHPVLWESGHPARLPLKK